MSNVYTTVRVEIHIAEDLTLEQVEKKIAELFENNVEMKLADWWDYYRVTPVEST